MLCSIRYLLFAVGLLYGGHVLLLDVFFVVGSWLFSIVWSLCEYVGKVGLLPNLLYNISEVTPCYMVGVIYSIQGLKKLH